MISRFFTTALIVTITVITAVATEVASDQIATVTGRSQAGGVEFLDLDKTGIFWGRRKHTRLANASKQSTCEPCLYWSGEDRILWKPACCRFRIAANHCPATTSDAAASASILPDPPTSARGGATKNATNCAGQFRV